MYSICRMDRDPWSVFDELFALQDDMEGLLGGQGRGRFGQSFPVMAAWTREDQVVVDAELPGVDPKAVEITVVGDVLTLKGSRDSEAHDGEADTYRQERYAGRFEKSLRLPFRVEADKVQAHYRNGVLRVTLPRAEADKRRTINIKAA